MAKTARAQQRTGIMVQDYREPVGQLAPKRDCAHYGCSGVWHNPDCEKIGLFGIDPYFNRPHTDEVIARSVKGRKATDQ